MLPRLQTLLMGHVAVRQTLGAAGAAHVLGEPTGLDQAMDAVLQFLDAASCSLAGFMAGPLVELAAWGAENPTRALLQVRSLLTYMFSEAIVFCGFCAG